MKFNGTIIGPASGKLGDKIFSRNQGGQYIKAHVIPTDPMTAEQIDMRDAMTDCKVAWDALTDAQRRAWRAYSEAFPRLNRIAQPRPAGGFQEFCRSNVIRRQVFHRLAITLAIVNDPPAGSASAPEPTPTVAISSTALARFFVSNFTGGEWRTEAGAGFLVYISTSQSVQTNWFRGPYTLFGCAQGSLSPTGLTVVATGQAPLTVGTRYFWRIRSTRADGRLGHPWTGFVLA